MRMYFVQIRRTMRALYWFVGGIIVILAMMSVFGNVTIYGTLHHTLDYRPPSSQETLHINLPSWPWMYTSEVSWPAFPWGRAWGLVDQPTHYSTSQTGSRPSRPKTFVLPALHYANKERTSVGTFVESVSVPRQRVVIYPNGYRHIIEVVTVKAPDGRPVQGHDEFQIDGLEVFGAPVALSWTLMIASLLCALFGVVVGVGLGEDVASHLPIVRTRPIGKTAFGASAIGIDVALLTLGVAIIGMLLVAVPERSFPFNTLTDGQASAAKLFAVCLVWSFTLACYGITLALTTAGKRVTALVVLSVVAVLELMISSSIGYGLPHPLDWLKPALDALNPIGHYAIVVANIFSSSATPEDKVDSTVYNLLALIGLALAGMLVAILRWRAARI